MGIMVVKMGVFVRFFKGCLEGVIGSKFSFVIKVCIIIIFLVMYCKGI